MPGIEDLTNIMVSGGRDDIPLSQGAAPMAPSTPQLVGGPPMGGPPMGGPPMGGPPMGGPAAAETLMANADMLGAGTERLPMEGAGGGGIEQDAMALADAVIGRAQGDINAALAILDGATQILIGSGQQGAPVPPPGAPLMAAHGRAISDRDSNQLGRTLSDRDQLGRTLSDSDLLAEAGTNPADIVRLLLGQKGREMSDRDFQQLASLVAASQGQEGKELSDKDLRFHLQMLGRTSSDRDTKRGKPGYNRRADGGSLMTRDYENYNQDEAFRDLRAYQT